MRLFLTLFCGLPLLSGSLFGWGCDGHQMVGLIARAHLTPATSAAVDQLLQAYPLDPAAKRYCQNRLEDPMADAASWADDMKSVDKTFTWHFVDIPLGAKQNSPGDTDVSRWCEPIGPSVDSKDRPGCVTTAIAYEWSILRDKNQPGAERAKALRYLVHFMGDLSQPLHDSDNHDQGGNCTRIAFFGQEKPENLHGIWDDRLLSRELAAHHATAEQYGAGLDRDFGKNWQAWGTAKTDVNAWAWEGHEISARVTYGTLNPAIPVADPALGQVDRAGCNVGRSAVEALHVTVGDDYMNATMPVIRQQLAKAGYRLAGLLNQGF